MARAIPKREWLEVEEDLCRTALLEYLMEHWLWERPVPGGYASPLAQLAQHGQDQLAQRAMAVHALEEFGWLEEPASDQADTKTPRIDAGKGA